MSATDKMLRVHATRLERKLASAIVEQWTPRELLEKAGIRIVQNEKKAWCLTRENLADLDFGEGAKGYAAALTFAYEIAYASVKLAQGMVSAKELENECN